MGEAYVVISEMFVIFNMVVDWFATTVGTVGEMFFADGKFTWLGAIALVALAISICFLFVMVIKAFIRFR